MLKKVAFVGAMIMACCCMSTIAIVLIGAPIAYRGLAKFVAEVGSIVLEDNRDCLINSKQVSLLKSYVPPKVRKTINPQFYTYFGFRDWWRYPLVYPYSIQAVDTTAVGYLGNDGGIKNYENGVTSYSIISGITRFSLDKNYLLAETTNSPFGDPGPEYTITYKIFAFETNEITEFSSQEAMFHQAQKLHFTGAVKLLTISQYDALFTCKK